MHKHLVAILIGLVFFLGGIPVAQAQAQEGEGLRIAPGVIEDKADPGSTFNFTLDVTNIAGTEKTFYLEAQDIKGFDISGVPIFSEENEPTEYEMSTWVSLPQESITLKADETRAIPFTVTVPASATPGSHFGGVFFTTQPPKTRTTGAAVGIKVGSVISLRISGDVIDDVRMREFSTSQFIYSQPNVTFLTKVENTGNALARPHGFIEVTDMSGKKVATVNVNETGAPAFPGMTREYSTEWSYEDFAIGRYTAMASLIYGEEEKKTVSATTYFWVLPFKPIATVAGILAVGAFILFMWVKMYIRRRLREAGITNVRVREQRSTKLATVSVAVTIFIVVFLLVVFVLFA